MFTPISRKEKNISIKLTKIYILLFRFLSLLLYQHDINDAPMLMMMMMVYVMCLFECKAIILLSSRAQVTNFIYFVFSQFTHTQIDFCEIFISIFLFLLSILCAVLSSIFSFCVFFNSMAGFFLVFV